MSDELLIALVPSLVTLVGVIITNIFTSSNNEKKRTKENTKVINDIKLEITEYHASTDEKIKELTREVRSHNGFAEKIPAIQENIKNLDAKINFLHKND